MLPDLRATANRWQAREVNRAQTIAALKNNAIEEVESPERLKKRVERLQENLGKEQLRISAPPDSASAIIFNDLGNERTINTRDFLNASFTELALAVARFVGRIIIKASPNMELGYGTGFMISPNLMLTNNHVFQSKQAAKFSLMEFDYQLDRFNKPLPSVFFEFDPDAFFMTDTDLDFSLVAVRPIGTDGKTKLSDYGWTRLIGEEGKILKGENVNIIQHPGGDYKKLVLRNNELIDLFDTYFHYITDTEQGSSGAPVLNDQWEVVALHHSGVPRVENGNIMTTDDRIWLDGMDENLIDWVANEGIRTSSLIKFIKANNNLSSSQKSMLNQLLEMEPPHPFEVADRAIENAKKNQNNAASGASTVISSGDSVSFSLMLPLQVQIKIGAPIVTGSNQSVKIETPAPIASLPPAGKQDDEPDKIDVRAVPEFQNAIKELAESKSKPYYDRVADEKDKQNYYAHLAQNADGADLYRALNTLLTQTHTTKPSYDPLKHVYPWIDLHDENGKRFIVSIYSGKRVSPEEFIEADVRRDLEVKRLRETFLQNKSSLAESAVFIDALEASLPYNCEHVVPQSWFNKKEPMRGDIHHLFACESNCNSFRSNIPYFDFPDFEETVRTDCGKREELKFEPGRGKGAVARATLYFLLRYPGEINATSKEYTSDRIKILIEWHNNSAPTEYELHRNQAIFARQGNRNPLIDHPEWADQIDFTLGLG